MRIDFSAVPDGRGRRRGECVCVCVCVCVREREREREREGLVWTDEERCQTEVEPGRDAVLPPGGGRLVKTPRNSETLINGAN